MRGSEIGAGVKHTRIDKNIYEITPRKVLELLGVQPRDGATLNAKIDGLVLRIEVTKTEELS